jgi:hypothetical protein
VARDSIADIQDLGAEDNAPTHYWPGRLETDVLSVDDEVGMKLPGTARWKSWRQRSTWAGE